MTMKSRMIEAFRVSVAASVIASSIALPALADSAVKYVSWGGSTQEGEVKGLLADARSLGITVREDRHGNWAGLKTYFQSGATGWDIVTMGFARCEQADKMGALQPIDYAVVDKTKIDAALSKPNYVGVYNFTYGLTYQKKKYAGNPPTTWADFWNVEKFPGRRSLSLDGLYALEAGLLASGVPSKDIYAVLKTPEGLERAMAMVDKIRPHIQVWWRTPAQIQEMLRMGDIDIALFPNARARSLVEDGADVAFEWNQAFIDQECLMVPKTATNATDAMKLINSALNPANQANFAKKVGYGPVNRAAFETGIMTPADISWMPMAPQNLAKQVVVDPSWYASSEADAAYIRFAKAIQ